MNSKKKGGNHHEKEVTKKNSSFNIPESQTVCYLFSSRKIDKYPHKHFIIFRSKNSSITLYSIITFKNHFVKCGNTNNSLFIAKISGGNTLI